MLLLLLALSCRDQVLDTGPFDDDGDGWTGDVDCDDWDPDVHPEAEDLCDRLDNDCDGDIDEDSTTTWYQDADGDGWGSDEVVVEDCERPEGYIERSGDCDDTSSSFHPNAREDDCEDDNDYNCDGSVGYEDADGDGVPACVDCDDADVDRQPGAAELCDSIDQDCDERVDEEAVDATDWWYDADGDGYGGELLESDCEAPEGFVDNEDDCDDLDASAFPGADEVCDGDDDDCDSSVDEEDAIDAPTWYADDDGDGFGDEDSTVAACTVPSGYLADDSDCDDQDDTSYPEAPEYCDDVDHDCDGFINEDTSVDAGTWYVDGDGDGYGDPALSSTSCAQPSGSVDNGDDCEDDDEDINPDLVWYADDDGDGSGDPDNTTSSCTQPSGYLADDSDCDDGDADRAEYCCSLGTDGDLSITSSTSLAAGTYSFDAFSIAKGVTVRVTGSTPLVINANTVDIAGALVLDAAGGTAGPAGGDGGAVGDCSTGAGDGDGPHQATSIALGGTGDQGGGGAGGAKIGTDGANHVGSGGGNYSTPSMAIFTGGAGGGAGGGDGGDGGGGGGAVWIVAVEIVVSGSISADGGVGADAGASCSSGGGGGGSGGMIWLHGETVSVTGSLSAGGGEGGSGDSKGGDASGGRIQVSGPSTSVSGSVSPAAYSDTSDADCEDG